MTAFNLSAFNAPVAAKAEIKSEFVKSQYWLNFGCKMPNGEFVTLPLGVGLDTMKPGVWGANSSADFIATVQSRNAFLVKIIDVAKQLQPGESAFLLEADGSPFAVQLLHIKQPTIADPTKVAEFNWDITLRKA